MENFGLTQIIIFTGILIGVFLVMREINLWYFKIDKRIQLQEETNSLLKKLLERNSEVENYNYDDSELDDDETDVNNPEALKKIIKDLNSGALK